MVSLYSSLMPNRGSSASTSGVQHLQPPAHHFPPSTRCAHCRGATGTRAPQHMAAAATSQVELLAESTDTDADDWDTTWVNDNGSQIPLDSGLELPAEVPAIDDTGNMVSQPAKKLPAEMRFFDTASIYVKAGDGGNGCVAFRREKFVPRDDKQRSPCHSWETHVCALNPIAQSSHLQSLAGGPAGGNGGRGGHIWAVVDAGLNSLTTFRKQLHYRGAPGTAGGGSRRHGAKGADVEIRVPRGTIMRRRDAGDEVPPLAELLQPGSRALLAVGGRGGRGNASFKTAGNNAPQQAELGEVGQELWVDLELKLVADVGIIGIPNAGKSTLLSVVSNAKPKVANYPFTTLVPNLGVCEMDFRTTVFADVPGLLEGAHTGVGLGHEFLRHCQRSRLLVHIIDGTSPDPLGDFTAIRTELQLFNPELLNKPQVVAYNKMDLPDSSDYWEEVAEQLQAQGIAREDLLAVSAVTGQGVLALVRRLHAVLDSLPAAEEAEPTTNALNMTEPPKGLSEKRIDEFTITTDLANGRLFFVEGEAIERFAGMTNWDYYEAQLRFQKVLEASGINKALKAKGIKEGDIVVVADMELEWSDDQSEGALYGRWLNERKSSGKPLKGTSSWPYAG